MSDWQTRRTFLLAAGTVAVAGCSGTDSTTDETETEAATTETGTPTPTESEAAGRLQVVNAVGLVDGDGIGSVEITVQRASGTGDVDLSRTTISWVGDSGTYDLTSEASGGGDAGFSVTAIQDGDGSIADEGVLNDTADRATVTIDIDAFGATLGEGATATAQLTTPSGGTTELTLVVPQTLSGSDAVAL